MNTKPVYWNRIGYISIEDDNSRMVNYGGSADGPYGGLDFKFSGTYYGMVYPVFTVSILGLSLETINRIAVADPKKANIRKRRIEVHAGYEKDNIARPLMTGYIYNAIPTNPPDMWLNIQCMSIANLLFRRVEKPVEIAAEDLKDLFEKGLAQAIGYEGKLKWNVEKKIPLPKKDRRDEHFTFIVDGLKVEALQKFGEKFGVTVASVKDRIVAVDRYSQLLKPSGNVQTIDLEHGLIGMNDITFAGCNINRRLDDTVGYNDWIRLKSQIVGLASGDYRVTSITHTGHLRGKEWMTTLKCLRRGVPI